MISLCISHIAACSVHSALTSIGKKFTVFCEVKGLQVITVDSVIEMAKTD